MRLRRPRLLLPLAALVALALPGTASAALSYGAVPSPSAYANGTVTFEIAAASPGTLTSVLRVDGTAARTASSWPATFTYDTSALGEGAHTFEIVTEVAEDVWVLDRRWTITVDRTPPASAPMAAGPLVLTTTASAMRLEWWLAGEMGTVEGTACTTTCRPIDARDLTRLELPVGTTTVRIWIRDRAGNSDPSRATVWTITRVDPSPAPGVAPAPAAPRPRVDPGLRIVSATASRDRRTVTVGGTLAVPHTNHVSVSVRVRIGRRTKTVRTTAVTSGTGFRATLRLPSARWSAATVTARVAGSSRYLTVEKRKTVRRR
jgi:hypothetical protein